MIAVIDIIKWVGGILGTFICLYSIYSIKMLYFRINKLEKEISDQQVKNEGFDKYIEFKDIKDEESKELSKTILKKMGELKNSFNTKFEELREDFHKLELKFVGGNKTTP